MPHASNAATMAIPIFVISLPLDFFYIVYLFGMVCQGGRYKKKNRLVGGLVAAAFIEEAAVVSLRGDLVSVVNFP